MINFRYHLVSLVAVFLALTIGIVAGSTVIRESLVQSLRDNVSRVEKRLDDVEKKNTDLQTQLADQRDRADQLGTEGPDRLLHGILQDVPVMVFSVDGVDGTSATNVRRSLGAANANLVGTVKLNDKLALTTPGSVEQLQEVLGSSTTQPDALRGELYDRLTALLAKLAWPTGSTAPPPTNVPSPTADRPDTSAEAAALRELLASLAQHGFVDYGSAAPDGTDLRGLRVLVLSGGGAKPADNIGAGALLGRIAGTGLPFTVAGEATPQGSTVPRGSFVGPLRIDNKLRKTVSTVDNAEGFDGWTAIVLALDALRQGRVGHYGVGDGADSLLPVRSS